MVQKIAEGIGLVGKTNRFAAGVSVDVVATSHHDPVCHSALRPTRDGLGYNED